ncbi:ABC-2 type transport system ATP-binding protein [Quadrisphaera granulorum]|uniref:ABC-2 type transport system ATP-binding protein n=1 Tax=Quadrisphaera granulorum TaxID=317664 RepID=A0A316A0T2_9ACTN|nr:ATP-binding cassette domain-containing protein [Quadrisphaera granulorum]PWJ51142.1 ABC-2 type transport system ATP-binding protein [Quadrisphaera granulorum]SZE97792.1 ABC-2 type transport system ATP-binding protein [Quadrisphaera granulorum]
MSEQVLVEVSDLAVVLGRGKKQRRAVDGLDLRLGAGVHGLLGPNGAGKTTLVRVLATVLPPSSGDISLLGVDVRDVRRRRELRRQIGYLPQAFGYYPRFTVREFVEYFAWLKEVPAARAGVAVDTALERVGLADRAGDRMKSLSGGMLRRAGVAQALVNDPRVLLLDEPTAGLDPEQRVAFRSLLRELALDAAVVVSTHLVEDVAGACTHVVLMEAGRVVATGTPAGLAEAGRRGLVHDGDGVCGLVGSGSADDGLASAIERGYTGVLRAARVSGPGAAPVVLPEPAASTSGAPTSAAGA